MKLLKKEIYFTKDERTGLYFIVFCIVALILAIIFSNRIYNNAPIVYDDLELVKIKDFNKTHSSIDQEGSISKKGKNIEEQLFNFNPNTTPLDSLKMLPIPNNIAERIDKYRSKGGSFKDKEDFKKVYGIEKYFEKLKPYIKIEKNKSSSKINDKKSEETNSPITSGVMNTTEIKYPPKQSKVSLKDSKDTFTYDPNDYIEEEEEIFVELNGANVYQLQLVRGVGEYYAEKIMAFKTKTGGFHDVNQLKDVIRRPELLEKVLPHFTCDQGLIRKRNFNTIQRDSLGYIPGISYTKANVAMNYRSNHYPIKGKEDLIKMRIFNEKEIELMLKYLSFEY